MAMDNGLRAIVDCLQMRELCPEGYAPVPRVREFCLGLLASHGVASTVDTAGNLIGARGNASWLLCAHMDTVDEGHGFDDLVGVAIILRLAEATNVPLRVLLTNGEETGQTGARYVKPEWFIGLRGALVLDRRGDSDLVTRIEEHVALLERCVDTKLRGFGVPVHAPKAA